MPWLSNQLRCFSRSSRSTITTFLYLIFFIVMFFLILIQLGLGRNKAKVIFLLKLLTIV